MIKVIYGAKGTGKTKMMIDAANAAVESAKGHLIFITDSNKVRMAGIVDKLTQDRAYFETVGGTFKRI